MRSKIIPRIIFLLVILSLSIFFIISPGRCEEIVYNGQTMIGDMFGLPGADVLITSATLIKLGTNFKILMNEKSKLSIRIIEDTKLKMYSFKNIVGEVTLNTEAVPINCSFYVLSPGNFSFPKIDGLFRLENGTNVSLNFGRLQINLSNSKIIIETTKSEIDNLLKKEKINDITSEGIIQMWKDKGVYLGESQGKIRYLSPYYGITVYLVGEHRVFETKGKMIFIQNGEIIGREQLQIYEGNEKFTSYEGFSVVGLAGIPPKIRVNEDGTLILEGKADFYGLIVLVHRENPLLIVSKVPIGYEGNYGFSKDERHIIFKASKNSKMEVYFGLTNKFYTSKTRYERLIIELQNGDQIEISNRAEQNLIPLVKLIQREAGQTRIVDGRLFFIINKNGIISRATPITSYFVEEKPVSGKIETLNDAYKMIAGAPAADFDDSIPIELNIEGKEQGIIVSSANLFSFFNQNSPGEVEINEFGVPVSRILSENLVVTLQDLEQIWPNIAFSIKTKKLTEIPAVIIQITHFWLKNNPNSGIKKVIFIDDFNAYATQVSSDLFSKADDVLGVGVAVDPYSLQRSMSLSMRTNKPFSVLDHEYEHTQSFRVVDEELSDVKANVKSDLDKELTDQKKGELLLADKKKVIFDMKECTSFLTPILSSSKSVEEKKDELKLWRNFMYISRYWGQVCKSQWPDDIYQTYKDRLGPQSLLAPDLCSEAFVEIAGRTLSWCQSEYNLKSTEISNIQADINASNFQNLNSYGSDLYSLGVDWMESEGVKRLRKKTSQQLAQDSLLKTLSNVVNGGIHNLKKDKDYNSIIASVAAVTGENKEDLLNDPSKSEQVLLALNRANPKKYSKVYHKFFLTVKKYLPAPYSARGYNVGIYAEPFYGEAVTTVVEQDSDVRVKNAKQYGGVYLQIEQVLFDTNAEKSSPELYQKIFGPCLMLDCLDKRCLSYKGECCKKYPTSPNCLA